MTLVALLPERLIKKKIRYKTDQVMGEKFQLKHNKSIYYKLNFL